jgi:hypothetical protein
MVQKNGMYGKYLARIATECLQSKTVYVPNASGKKNKHAQENASSCDGR